MASAGQGCRTISSNYFGLTDCLKNKAQAFESVSFTGISAKAAHENQKSWKIKPVRGLERFDPFHSMHYEQSQLAPTKWIDILGSSQKIQFSEDVEENRGRRITKWHFFKGVNNDLTPKIICRKKGREIDLWSKTVNAYQLRNLKQRKYFSQQKKPLVWQNVRSKRLVGWMRRKASPEGKHGAPNHENGFLRRTSWLW